MSHFTSSAVAPLEFICSGFSFCRRFSTGVPVLATFGIAPGRARRPGFQAGDAILPEDTIRLRQGRRERVQPAGLVEFHVLPQGAWMGIAFLTTVDLANVRLVRRVYMRVLLPVAGVCETAITAGKFAHERLLTGVSSLVDLEVLGAREELTTARKRARKRLLPRMHADVVNQLVFGLKRFPASLAVLPEAHMQVGVAGCDVLVGQVAYQIRHVCELLAARLSLALQRILVDPHASDDLVRWLFHQRQVRRRRVAWRNVVDERTGQTGLCEALASGEKLGAACVARRIAQNLRHAVVSGGLMAGQCAVMQVWISCHLEAFMCHCMVIVYVVPMNWTGWWRAEHAMSARVAGCAGRDRRLACV